MSTLYYGGSPGHEDEAGVLLTRCQLLAYETEPVSQGRDYLYTIHRLRVRGIFNPQVNAYDFATRPTGFLPAVILGALAGSIKVGPGGNTRDVGVLGPIGGGNVAGMVVSPSGPVQSMGTTAPTTAVAIRHYMMQPRRQLVYAVGPRPILVAPNVNANGGAASRDANNGPVPLACDVVHVSGTKTFVVDFAIEAYVNEAYLYKTTPTVLLSHRWGVIEDIDQDYYSTRVISGLATFRSDRLAFLNSLPDDFRVALFHPLPSIFGWKRTLAHIEANEDGTALSYTLVDKQVPFGIVPEHVTRVEAFQTVGSNKIDLYEKVPEAVGDFLQKWLFGGDKVKPLTVAGYAGFGLLHSMKPQLETEITVRVWGDSRSFRSDLQNVVIGIILQRLTLMSQNKVALKCSTTEFQLTHDLVGNFVEGRCAKITAFTDAPFATEEGGSLAILPDVAQYFPSGMTGENTSGFIEYNNASLLQRRGLPRRTNVAGTGTRGNWIVRLATAALLASDATPQNPPFAAPVSTSDASDDVVTDQYPP